MAATGPERQDTTARMREMVPRLSRSFSSGRRVNSGETGRELRGRRRSTYAQTMSVTRSSSPLKARRLTDLSRRALLGALPALAVAACRRAPAVTASRPTDIRIAEVNHAFEEHRYRAPYQFGGRTVDRVTILNVNCRVRTGDGKDAWGFGSMTLGNAWAFPAASQDAGLGAMKTLAATLRSRRRRRATTAAIPSISSGRSNRPTSAAPTTSHGS